MNEDQRVIATESVISPINTGASGGIRTPNLLIRRSVMPWACWSGPGSAGLDGGMRGIRGDRRRPLNDRLNDSPSTVDSPRWTVTVLDTRSAGGRTRPPTLITEGDGASGISRAGTDLCGDASSKATRVVRSYEVFSRASWSS
jgi:hypothetical protein